ncbi:alpha/beta hydrolase-fold protein [Actinoplanes sp. NBRC 101535]|uniref:alpha/beta hydrolase-fold protein n=1 Tax=Actinoplanes sp. NBRC 101535 TaxID=3032196 RepID=UPI0024A5B7A8|nr:alpha/beta hydrolase-fold protein [Actinoplanes sp. NBRC 101535]GLY08707.1 esterase [Actinoplanes sp. NBRC 101535]
MRRRSLLVGAVVVAGAGVTATAGAWAALGSGPEPARPGAEAGDERLERRHSGARGQMVDFYTAVPAGYGDGRGLPVCLVLHGGSKRPADFAALGLGGFLTEAVRRGAPPFVLAGATGDRLAWRRHPGDDPQRMVHEEIPAWCDDRGFDTVRFAAWGWSMGGSGSLLLAGRFPGFLRAVAAFSPAVTPSDEVFALLHRLSRVPVGLWCGTDDDLLPNVRAAGRALPVPAAVADFGPGRHDFTYWSRRIPAAFSFLGAALTSP